MLISKLDILSKCITLLYRESILEDSENDNSKDLVKSILTATGDPKNRIVTGGESIIIEDLRNFIKDMSNSLSMYDEDSILQSLGIILKDRETIFKVLEKAVKTEMSTSGLKRSISSLRNQLNSYYNNFEIRNTINKANYQLMTDRVDEDMKSFVEKLIVNLEALTSRANVKDQGIVDEIDFSDGESVTRAMDNVKKLNETGGKLITGWKAVNKMLNGGFRKGEQWVISALQHNYKSGLTQSLFAQLPRLNMPEMRDSSKKPLMVLFSLEDDINIVAEFLYRYLYYNENKTLPDLTTVTGKEIAEYITKKLTVNGYSIKILRINPSEWSYKALFTKVLEYEAAGFEIHGVFIDYLSKLPTIGCINTGPTGTDVRDLFNRTRNFFSSKQILNITPHQISTEALSLFRGGIKGFDFINEISNKNYYSESKQIPQVVDGEIYITKGKHNKQWALYLGKGKHRSPVITPDEDKQCMLMFPKGAPIPEDIHDEESDISLITGEAKINTEFDF